MTVCTAKAAALLAALVASALTATWHHSDAAAVTITVVRITLLFMMA